MIHRYWSGPWQQQSTWTAAAARSTNRCELIEWADEPGPGRRALPVDVVDWLNAHERDVVEADRLRHRANLVRLWVLDTHGGWWVDHDVVLLSSLRSLPYPMAAAHSTLCSCVLGLPIRHPLLSRALTYVDRSPSRPGRSLDVSGERLLGQLRPNDVTLVELPVDPDGRRTSAPAWAVHLFNTRNR